MYDVLSNYKCGLYLLQCEAMTITMMQDLVGRVLKRRKTLSTTVKTSGDALGDCHGEGLDPAVLAAINAGNMNRSASCIHLSLFLFLLSYLYAYVCILSISLSCLHTCTCFPSLSRSLSHSSPPPPPSPPSHPPITHCLAHTLPPTVSPHNSSVYKQ